MESVLESKKEEGGGEPQFESDVDKMLYEVHGMAGVEIFNELWSKHPEWSLEQALKEFEKEPTHGQTYFFRYYNLKATAKDLVARLKKKEGEVVEILDVGCSTGEEAYSLAAHILENGHKSFRIDGIDVSPKKIQEAQIGEYKLWLESVNEIGKSMLDSSHLEQGQIQKGYFVDNGKRWERRVSSYKYSLKELFEMKKRGEELPQDRWNEVSSLVIEPGKIMKDRVVFQIHDIIDGPPPGKYDIVVMNNVLLHYPEKTREMMLRNALASLRPGGFLVLECALFPLPNEERWRGPYNEWRREFAERFSLEEISVGDSMLKGERMKTGEYFRFVPSKVYGGARNTGKK